MRDAADLTTRVEHPNTFEWAAAARECPKTNAQTVAERPELAHPHRFH
jgi:hypothetical protein